MLTFFHSSNLRRFSYASKQIERVERAPSVRLTKSVSRSTSERSERGSESSMLLAGSSTWYEHNSSSVVSSVPMRLFSDHSSIFWNRLYEPGFGLSSFGRNPCLSAGALAVEGSRKPIMHSRNRLLNDKDLDFLRIRKAQRTVARDKTSLHRSDALLILNMPAVGLASSFESLCETSLRDLLTGLLGVSLRVACLVAGIRSF